MFQIWFGESLGDLVSSLFKLGRYALYLLFYRMIFFKQVFDLEL